MSTTGRSHDDDRPLKGPVTCFLPNCAFFVQPHCPTCMCKQKQIIEIKASTASQLNTDDKEGKKPAINTNVFTLDGNGHVNGGIHRFTEPQVFNVGFEGKKEPPAFRPNRSLFEVDTGTAWIECDECKGAFQVYISATFSTVAALPLPTPTNPAE